MSTAVDTDIPMRLEPVDERSVWLGDELRRDDKWSHQITDTELRELLAATETVHSAGLKVGDFGQEDFPLPTLGPQIKKLVDEVENGRGVALLKGFPVGELSEDMLRLAYWGFGVYAGNIISQNSKGQLLAEVSDRGNAYGDRNTRGFSTNAELLPHVDTSDMTTLLCLRPARTGGESRVLSSTAVYNAILREAPEHLGVLYRGFQNDLRGEGP
ncbi:MAG: TauD/TfdA family dioxygenase, partial [Gammaproteobacteria bacterium]